MKEGERNIHGKGEIEFAWGGPISALGTDGGGHSRKSSQNHDSDGSRGEKPASKRSRCNFESTHLQVAVKDFESVFWSSETGECRSSSRSKPPIMALEKPRSLRLLSDQPYFPLREQHRIRHPFKLHIRHSRDQVCDTPLYRRNIVADFLAIARMRLEPAPCMASPTISSQYWNESLGVQE